MVSTDWYGSISSKPCLPLFGCSSKDRKKGLLSFGKRAAGSAEKVAACGTGGEEVLLSADAISLLLQLFPGGDALLFSISYTIRSVAVWSHKRGKQMSKLICDVYLGTNIHLLRTDNNMTQEELVARMQLMGSMITRSTLANIESCRRNIKVSDLMIMKMIFNVDYGAFFPADAEDKLREKLTDDKSGILQ